MSAFGLARLVVFIASLIPLARLFWLGMNDGLSANPVEFVTRSTGTWALVFLCLSLGMTPLRRLTGWTQWIRLRRMLGLYSFFYALLHLLSYAWFDMGFDWAEILRDIAKRPFILVGSLALALLALLAATSFNRAIKALGGRRWQLLHRSVYAVAGLAVLHFFWMRAGKNDFAEVAVYAAILGVLLGWRVWQRLRTAAGTRLQRPYAKG